MNLKNIEQEVKQAVSQALEQKQNIHETTEKKVKEIAYYPLAGVLLSILLMDWKQMN